MYLQSHDIKQGLGKNSDGSSKQPNKHHNFCIFFLLYIDFYFSVHVHRQRFSSDPCISVLAFKTLVNFEAEHLKLWESPLIIHLFYKMFAFWIIFSDIQSLLQFYERLNTSYAPLYNLNLLSQNGLQKCIKQIASVNQIETYISRYKNVLKLAAKMPCHFGPLLKIYTPIIPQGKHFLIFIKSHNL